MEEGLKICLDDTSFLPSEQYSPLTLAFIGDAVFELYVRGALIKHANRPVSILHKQASLLVRAEAQSRMIQDLKDELTEDEYNIYRRGRNAKSNTVPKNASVNDYRRATGFEALIGYLQIEGRLERMNELMNMAIRRECERNEAKQGC